MCMMHILMPHLTKRKVCVAKKHGICKTLQTSDEPSNLFLEVLTMVRSFVESRVQVSKEVVIEAS